MSSSTNTLTPSSSSSSSSSSTTVVTLANNDHFFISYRAGYALFLSVAVLTSLAFAAFWGYCARRHDTWASRRQGGRWGRHGWNALLLMSFEASVVLLTWGGSVYSTTFDRGQTSGPYLGMPGLLIGTVCLWIPLAFLTDFLYIRQTGRSNRSVSVLFGIFLTTTLAVLPGFTMLTVYCKQMSILEDYTYYGPMVITDVAVESLKRRGHFAQLRHKDTHKDSFIYIAKPRVHWGWEWGCPQAPTTWCSANVYEPDCVHCSGHSSEHGFDCLLVGNASDSKQCVESKYHFPDTTTSQGGNITFDPIVSGQNTQNNDPLAEAQGQTTTTPPGQQLYFYGDCNSCNAMVSASHDFLIRHNQSLRDMGIGLELLAIGIYSTFAMWIFVSDRIGKNDQNQQDSATDADVEEQNPETLEGEGDDDTVENGDGDGENDGDKNEGASEEAQNIELSEFDGCGRSEDASSDFTTETWTRDESQLEEYH